MHDAVREPKLPKSNTIRLLRIEHWYDIAGPGENYSAELSEYNFEKITGAVHRIL